MVAWLCYRINTLKPFLCEEVVGFVWQIVIPILTLSLYGLWCVRAIDKKKPTEVGYAGSTSRFNRVLSSMVQRRVSYASFQSSEEASSLRPYSFVSTWAYVIFPYPTSASASCSFNQSQVKFLRDLYNLTCGRFPLGTRYAMWVCLVLPCLVVGWSRCVWGGPWVVSLSFLL